MQRSTRSIHGVRRHISSSSKTNSRPQNAPSTTKMRALVALFHEAEKFITPETLSQKIDDAFLGTSDVAFVAMEFSKDSTLQSMADLKRIREERRKNPKIAAVWEDNDTLYNRGRMPFLLENWSAVTARREEEVIEALYGSHSRTKPGWENLKESVEALERDMVEDENHS